MDLENLTDATVIPKRNRSGRNVCPSETIRTSFGYTFAATFCSFGFFLMLLSPVWVSGLRIDPLHLLAGT